MVNQGTGHKILIPSMMSAMAAPTFQLLILLGILHAACLITVTPGILGEDKKSTVTDAPDITHPDVGDTALNTSDQVLPSSQIASTSPTATLTEISATQGAISESITSSPVLTVTPTIDSDKNNLAEEAIGVTIIIDNLKKSVTSGGATVHISPSLTVDGTTEMQTKIQDSPKGSYSTHEYGVSPTPEGATVLATAVGGATVSLANELTSLSVTQSTLPLMTAVVTTSPESVSETQTTGVLHTKVLTPSLGDVINISSAYMTTPEASVIYSTPEGSSIQPASPSVTAAMYATVTPSNIMDNITSVIQPTSVIDMSPTSANISSLYVETVNPPLPSLTLHTSSSYPASSLQSLINETQIFASLDVMSTTEYISPSMITPALQMSTMALPDSVNVSMDASMAPFTSSMNVAGSGIEASSLEYATLSTTGPLPTVDASFIMASSPVYTESSMIVPTAMYNDSSTFYTPSLPPMYMPDSSASIPETTTNILTTTTLLMSTISIDEVSTTVIPTTVGPDTTVSMTMTTETPVKKYALKIKLVLSGNCTVLNQMKAADNLNDFNEKITSALSERLRLDVNHIKLEGTECGSVIVVVRLMNLTPDMGVEELVTNMSRDGELFTTSNGNSTLGFTLISSEILPPDKVVPPTDDRAPAKEIKLTDVQIIVIIVCSIVGGMLLIYAFGFCIYACYQKKKTKSFDLGETPVNNLHMEDFTLTKLQRPQPMYTEYGPVVHQRGPNGRSKKKNGLYQPIEDEMQCLAPEDVHQARALPQRSTVEVSLDTEIDSSHANADGPRGKSAAGFDNPSFSSDDILDSGPDTDHELPLDPEPHRGTGNNDYRVDNMVTNGNTNGRVRGEVATSF